MNTTNFGLTKHTVTHIFSWLLFLSLAYSSASNAQLNPGDVFVTDRDALFDVDPITGQRTVVSDFDDPTKGPLGNTPHGVAIGNSGNILVTDPGAGTRLPDGEGGALFTVDPATGQRALISDFGNLNQGPLGLILRGVAIGNSGNILVTDASGGTGFLGALFSVDPLTGQRTVLSDFGDPNQGPLGRGPHGVAIGNSGSVLVVNLNAGTNLLGALFSVDPTTGQRTVISDFGDPTQGPLGRSATGLAIGESGNILVIDDVSATAESGKLLSVDPATGQRTVISDFGDPTQGPLGRNPFGVAVVPELLTCFGKIVTIKGTPGHDILPGTNGDDVIHGLDGHDIISAGDGDDRVCGGDGKDILIGGNGRDRLFGQGGDDVVIGGEGNDRLLGGSQDDVLIGGNGNDSLDGDRNTDVCIGNRGADSAVNCEIVRGVP